MEQEQKNTNSNIIKKPLARNIAGGFLFAIFLLAIWMTYSFEVGEKKILKISDTAKGDMLEKYLSDKKESEFKISIFERAGYSVIKEENRVGLINKFLTSPFEARKEKCYADNYFSAGDNLIFNNINIKELSDDFEKITEVSLAGFLSGRNLAGDFGDNLVNKILSVFNGKAKAAVSFENNNLNYYGQTNYGGGPGKTSLRDMERSISYLVASFYPEKRKMILPDDSYVWEMFVSPDDFSFQDGAGGVRYIKNDDLSFEFAYRLESGKLIFSSSIQGLDKKIPEFKNCGREGIVIMAVNFLDDALIDKKYLEKYKTAIFVEEENGEIKIILK